MRAWIVPAAVAVVAFIGVRPVLADFLSGGRTSVATGSITVGAETIDGYGQIFAVNATGFKAYLTSGHSNHSAPVTSGDFVAWVETVNGAGQVELYQRSTGASVALTSDGTNLNPRLDDQGEVVWERWDGDRWQIWYFDGTSTRQLTTGDVAVHPAVSSGHVAYARQSDGGVWRAEQMNVATSEVSSLGQTATGTYPHFSDGSVNLDTTP